MNNTKSVTDLLKWISLIIIDIITFLLVFSVWALVNIPLFPWAIIAILSSLILVNGLILVSNNLIKELGIASYASMLISTLLYYGFVMIYTGMVYTFSSQKGYIITVLLITLAYIAIMAGLYVSGVNHKVDLIRHSTEKVKVMDVNLQLIQIHDSINNCKESIEMKQYDAIIFSYEAMKERLAASTPFGRVSKPIVIEMETKLSSSLSMLNDTILLLNTSNGNQSSYESIIKFLSDIKTLIMNREKLIIQ